MLEASEGRATGNVEERAGPGGQATVHTVEGRLGLEPRRQLLITACVLGRLAMPTLP